MTALPRDEADALIGYFNSSGQSQLEWSFMLAWMQQGYKRPTMFQEYRFHPTRRWRFDFAIPALKLAVEVEGGEWKQGRHNRPTGFIKDAEKYNAAGQLGWLVLRFPGSVIRCNSDGVVSDVKAAIRRRKRQCWPGLRAELRANSPIRVRRIA